MKLVSLLCVTPEQKRLLLESIELSHRVLVPWQRTLEAKEFLPNPLLRVQAVHIICLALLHLSAHNEQERGFVPGLVVAPGPWRPALCLYLLPAARIVQRVAIVHSLL